MNIRRVILALPLLTLTAALGGCGWMSVSGPAATDILAGQRDPMSLNYAVVKLTPKVVEVLSKNLPRLSTFSTNQRPRDITFGVGDILTVTIFEAASGGLFIPAEGAVRPGNFVAIPNQAVDVSGNISNLAVNTWTVIADQPPSNAAVSSTPSSLYAGHHVVTTVTFTDDGFSATVSFTLTGKHKDGTDYRVLQSSELRRTSLTGSGTRLG